MKHVELTWTTLRMIEPDAGLVVKHAPGLAAFYNEPTNKALLTNDRDFDAAAILEQYADAEHAGDRSFLLFDGDRLIGDCDFRRVDKADKTAEFAILIGPRTEQGKGLGTRFTTMALAFAFHERKALGLGLRRAFASIRPENTGSLRMFQKVGFIVDDWPEARQYAEADDDVCMSIGCTQAKLLHEQAFSAMILREVHSNV
jgi:RimJ/RimL family protein N-acetyltransferase